MNISLPGLGAGFVQGAFGGVKGERWNYLPGLEPDFDIRQELRFIGGILDLRQFDKVFISLSGGKDSHAMTFLAGYCRKAGLFGQADLRLCGYRGWNGITQRRR